MPFYKIIGYIGLVVSIGLGIIIAISMDINESMRMKTIFLDFKNKTTIEIDSLEFQICSNKAIVHPLYIDDQEIWSEKMPIPEAKYPCPVTITIYSKAEVKEYKTEDFDCAGCEGDNKYILTENGIKYEYWP